MQALTRSLLAAAALVVAGHASAQITMYEGEGFRGRATTFDRAQPDFTRIGLNDRVASIVVERGRWLVCEDIRFEGRCVILTRGSYDSLRPLGMSRMISSVRPVDGGRRERYEEIAAPMERPDYQYRRRSEEQVFQAQVTSVRAVMGPPQQRCWVERREVQAAPNSNQVGGAIAGAIIGGVLGHQVGGGSGKDAATAAGAIGGAVVGSNMAGGAPGTTTQDVQRCRTTESSGPPAYWDVTYNFRGREHRIQMSAPPGATVTVNGMGEPRM